MVKTFSSLKYDLSAAQFSPDGRIFQVEYANKAVEASGTAVGITCKDGVVLAVEKIVTSKYSKILQYGLSRRSYLHTSRDVTIGSQKSPSSFRGVHISPPDSKQGVRHGRRGRVVRI